VCSPIRAANRLILSFDRRYAQSRSPSVGMGPAARKSSTSNDDSIGASVPIWHHVPDLVIRGSAYVTEHGSPATVLVLVVLFAVQQNGTARIVRLFGPVMLIWFVTIALLGVWDRTASGGLVGPESGRWP